MEHVAATRVHDRLARDPVLRALVGQRERAAGTGADRPLFELRHRVVRPHDGSLVPEDTVMNVTRLRRAALVIAAAALLGCGEPPLGPVPPPPQASLIGSLLQATGLLGCTPMPTATATQTVGPAGGVIRIGPHALSIPAGRPNTSVTLPGAAPPGN